MAMDEHPNKDYVVYDVRQEYRVLTHSFGKVLRVLMSAGGGQHVSTHHFLLMTQSGPFVYQVCPPKMHGLASEIQGSPVPIEPFRDVSPL